MEDPIFDPWSADGPTPDGLEPTDRLVKPSPRPDLGAGAAHVLRAAAVPRLEAISRQLALARHATAIQDLLDGAPRLLRFELTPWAGPLAGSGPAPKRPQGPAMLEIGLGAAADELVTAWYWLDRNESPDEVVSVLTAVLSASWIDRVVLDFVRKALQRR